MTALTATPSLTDLAVLTTGLAQDAGLRLTLGDHWCFNASTRTLEVDAADLQTQGVTYCAGLIAHEVGHYFISRYNRFRPWPAVEAGLQQSLLNALEDPRVEAWMAARYPGAGRWLAQVQSHEYHQGFASRLGDVPAFLAFAWGCAYEPTHDWQPPAALKPNVRQALDETRVARRGYHACQPPTLADPSPLSTAEQARYRQEVWPNLRDKTPTLGDAWSQRVLLSAWQAYALAQAEILPVAQSLWTADCQRLGTSLQQDSELAHRVRQALTELAGSIEQLARLVVQVQQAAKDGRAGTASAQRLATELLQTLLADLAPQPIRRQGVAGQPADTLSEAPLTPPSSQPATPASTPPALPEAQGYAGICQGQQLAIDTLCDHIEAAVQPRRRLQERSGYPSGGRVEPQRVMAYLADPRRYDQLWVRKTLPERRDLAVSLLVDLSGSMRGGKIEAALDGVVLLAESLQRLQIDFAINGFQDILIPLCDFGETLTPTVQERLMTIPLEVDGECPGGNNEYSFNDDGPCLREAAEALVAYPSHERVLIAISDGLPEGKYSTRADLCAAIAAIEADLRIRLIGVGIGPRTEHVNDYYPQALANVPVEDFADTLGRLLQRLLGVNGNGLAMTVRG